MNGELDAIQIPKDNFPQAITKRVNLTPELEAKGVRLTIEAGISFYYVSFNMKDKLIGSNKRLRQALSSAVDRDQWIDVFTNGTGQKQETALPPGLLDRPEHQKLKYDFNLNRAKELLKAAGYPNGKGLPVLRFDMRGADSINRQLGDFFIRQFERIGVKIDVTYNTFPAYLEKMKQGDLQVSIGGWVVDYPDAENVFQLLYGPNQAPGPNESNFNNPEMNHLYEQMAVLDPGPKRKALIKKMDDLLQEECPWALGYYHSEYQLSYPWVSNFRANEIIVNKYKYFRMNPEIKKRYANHP